MTRLKNEWIRDGLTRRGYRQKDLAVSWGSQQASVSRFLGGEELQDLPLSKAVSLSRMLDITVDELAKGLGFNGVAVEPSIEGAGGGSTLAIGTVNLTPVAPGLVRLEVRKDMTVPSAQQIVGIIAMDQPK